MATISGTAGNDVLLGTPANDVIKALAGNDTIDSGGGQDTIAGGSGADIFILRANQPRDLFNDFVRGSDLFQLDGLSLDQIELKPTSAGTNIKQGTLVLASVKGVTLTASDFATGGGGGGASEDTTPISIGALDAAKNEGNSGTTAFTFTVGRPTGPLTPADSVTWTVTGIGGAPANAADFAGPLTGTISFGPAVDAQTLTILVTGDTNLEADETFRVTLSSPALGTIGTGTASGTILNDDGPPSRGGGGTGTPTTVATNGDDYLVFGSGNDVIKALAGNDTIDSGGGQDTVTGGTGADVFILRADQPRDVINDFGPGSDLIQLEGLALDQIELKPTSGGTNIKQGTLTLASVKGVTLSLSDLTTDGTGTGGGTGGGDTGGGGSGGDTPGVSGYLMPAALPGVWIGTLPTIPDGTTPSRSFASVTGSPSGDIYVSASDHVKNAGLYQIHEDSKGLGIRFLGDAKRASQNVDNWLSGETAEKFHNIAYHEGHVYVATTDYSPVDTGYLQSRGFHWYGYSESAKTFRDLSAGEPSGVGAEHVQLMGIVADAPRDLLYGIGTPTGELFRYHIATGEHENLGKPPLWTKDLVFVRALWTDAEGRVYLTAGRTGDGGTFDKVHFYDPTTDSFDVRSDWDLVGGLAINSAYDVPGTETTLISDDDGNFYAFDDAADDFRHLGRIDVGNANLWSAHFSPDGSKAYGLTAIKKVGGGFPADADGALIEYDVATNAARKIADFADLDPRLAGYWLTGFSAWDDDGRFYVAGRPADNPSNGTNVQVVAIDPDRVAQALGLDDAPSALVAADDLSLLS